MKRAILFFICFLALSSTIVLESARADFETIFAEEDAAFVLYNPIRHIERRYNPEGCTERYPPCSTFKIPNTLIGLETGVIEDASYTLTWDQKRDPRQAWWPESWAEDHNLTSAFSNSVLWYYQEIAREVGEKNYINYLNWFAYGNQDISGGIDEFWLSGPLLISVNEQIGWIEKFYNMELGVSARSTDIVKDILILEEGDLYLFSGKTGSGKLPNGDFTGWLVGYFEVPEEVYYYALNIKSEDSTSISEKTYSLVRQVFVEMGLLPDRVAER